jgi:hypothetical protein
MAGENERARAGAKVLGLPVFSKPVYGGRVLRELMLDGCNIIRPWGIEFADSSAFYSMEDGFGYRYELLDHLESVNGDSHKVVQIVRMREGLVRLELNEGLEEARSFRRTCTLTCLEDTTLMDFVLRYRFLASEFPGAFIADRTLTFARTCIYHQHPVDTAAVGNGRSTVRVTVLERVVPANMKAVVYLRDGEDAWVLHVRMLPAQWEKEVIKLCSRWFGTRPMPQWVSGPVLGIPWVREALWYRGERRPWRNPVACVFSPNAYPMAHLGKGEVLRWDTNCRIEAPLPGAKGRREDRERLESACS